MVSAFALSLLISTKAGLKRDQQNAVCCKWGTRRNAKVGDRERTISASGRANGVSVGYTVLYI